MQECGFLVEVVLISKAGKGKGACFFPCFNVVPFCSPLGVINTIFLLLTFQIAAFADDFMRKP